MTEPKASEHMPRGDFMQHLHNSVNAYAQHWDEPRPDPKHPDTKHPEPTTRAAWLADFKIWLDSQAEQEKQAQHQAQSAHQEKQHQY